MDEVINNLMIGMGGMGREEIIINNGGMGGGTTIIENGRGSNYKFIQ